MVSSIKDIDKSLNETNQTASLIINDLVDCYENNESYDKNH